MVLEYVRNEEFMIFYLLEFTFYYSPFIMVLHKQGKTNEKTRVSGLFGS